MIDKYQKAEIDEFYDGTWQCCTQLGIILKIDPRVVKYYADGKYKKEQKNN